MTRPARPATVPADGVRISVLVTPRASTNSVEVLAVEVRVRVTAAPADGAANQAVVRVLADALGVAPGRLRILSGATARRKLILVSGLSADQLEARLRELGAQASVARRRSTAGRIPPAR